MSEKYDELVIERWAPLVMDRGDYSLHFEDTFPTRQEALDYHDPDKWAVVDAIELSQYETGKGKPLVIEYETIDDLRVRSRTVSRALLKAYSKFTDIKCLITQLQSESQTLQREIDVLRDRPGAPYDTLEAQGYDEEEEDAT